MSKLRTILLVDDDPDIRDALTIILEKNGYRVNTALSGRTAMKALKQQRPDLMILDIMMDTDTDGFDLAYHLKNDPDFQGIPIIILTSFLEKVREEGPEQYQHILGEDWPAKWIYEKPVNSKKLMAKIEGILAET